MNWALKDEQRVIDVIPQQNKEHVSITQKMEELWLSDGLGTYSGSLCGQSIKKDKGKSRNGLKW